MIVGVHLIGVACLTYHSPDGQGDVVQLQRLLTAGELGC
jgi:hypothetical protein